VGPLEVCRVRTLRRVIFLRGSSSHSGPAPDPSALRRDRDGGEWVSLPASGREGPTPAWPLQPKATKRQAELWETLWAKPQAIMWELRGQQMEVALYVRRFSEAEKPGSPVTLSTWVVRQMEVLGLSSMGLRANKWRIGDEKDAVKRQQVRSSGPSARERFQVVDGAAG
jgi:hypothetical protein